MTTLDDQIRMLLREQLAAAPASPTVAEINQHLQVATVPLLVARTPRRRVWPVVAAAVAAAAALVAVLTIDWSVDHDRVVPAGPRLTPEQLLLPQMPADWLLVHAEESTSDGDGDAVAIYTRAAPASRVVLRALPGGDPESAAHAFDHTLDVAGGGGSWSGSCGGRVCFNVAWPTATVFGDVAGAGSVQDLVSYISVGADRVPVLDPASGYVLERSGTAGREPVAQLHLMYAAPVDGAGLGFYSIEAGDGLLDASLMAGATSTPKEVAGQVYWVDDENGTVWWMHDGARYRLSDLANGDVLEAATAVQPVSPAELTALFASVGVAAPVVDTASVVVDGRTLTFEERQSGEVWRFVCLVDGAERRCQDMPDGGAASILVGGHWYVVRADQSSTPSPVVEMVVVGDKKWRVSAIADDIDAVQVTIDAEGTYSLTRPLP